MKKILYLTNTPVPYRIKFFNLLAEKCDLTVVYEREASASRDKKWTDSEQHNYKTVFLKGINIKDENRFSFKMLKYALAPFDAVIVGCYNSPAQMLAILFLRLFKKNFYINLDGEPFIEEKGLKGKLKRFFLKGAVGYFTAGDSSAKSLKEFFPDAKIFPYYFSSLTKQEIENNTLLTEKREDYFLVVGRYLYCKGLDLVVKIAKENRNLKFKIIGTGDETQAFISDYNLDLVPNIEVVPFLQKDDLKSEYQKCRALILPSRKECWGLVVNEAASFGTPIISTYGSGAAVEFLSGEYEKFLSIQNDEKALENAINEFLNFPDTSEYSNYLYKKSLDYSIDKNAQKHIEALLDCRC